MPTPYKDLEFSFYQRCVMRYIRYHSVSREYLNAAKHRFLITYCFVERFSPTVDLYRLNEKGKMYLRNHRRSQRKYRITTAIAVFAAIGAYRGELAFLLQAIAKLLK